MSFFQQDYSPPPPPPPPPELRTFDQVRSQVALVDAYLRRKGTLDQSFLTSMVATINQNSNGFGLDIASATTISPTNFMHVVTGVATIATINVPLGFNGQLALVSKDGFATSAAGNIANAINAPANALVTLVWVPSQSKWYVTAVSVPTIPDGSITTAKLAPGAASASSTLLDNTAVSIGASDTQVGTASIIVAATSDVVQIVGLVTVTAGGAAVVTAKVWRGTVPTGTVLSSNNFAVFSGPSTYPFTFFDSGLSGAQSYSVSLSSGSAVTKTTCALVVTDFRAQ